MRTELRHGLLFFAHGGNDVYWLIQLRDGRLLAEFGVVDFQQSLMYERDGHELCDGNWHTVEYETDCIVLQTNFTVYVLPRLRVFRGYP